MRRTLRKLGTLGDVAASGGLVAVAAVVNFCAMLVFARGLGPTAFGLYSTCRRVVAFVAPLVNFGGHLGVSRYLGFYTGEARPRSAVLTLAVMLCVVALPITAGVFLALQTSLSQVEWIRSLTGAVWLATLALTAATAAGLVVFSTLRGFGHPQVANMHQLCVLSSVLVIGLALWGGALEVILASIAVASTGVNIVFLAWVVRVHRSELVRPAPRELRASLRELAPYSLSRLADGPLQAALSLIGIVMAPAIGGLELSGYIHISQTLVRMTEMLIVPLSIIFLPLVARQVRAGEKARIERQAQLIYDSVMLMGCVLVVQGMLWAGPLLSGAFGAKYGDATPFLMVTLPSMLPFLLFAGFRSFIDGYSVRPVNSIHMVFANVVILALSVAIGGLRGGVGLSLSYTVGMLFLGALTVRYAARHFTMRVFSTHTVQAVGLAVLGGVLALPAAWYARGLGAVPTFALCAVNSLFVAAILLATALRLGHPTVMYSQMRIRSARGLDGASLETEPSSESEGEPRDGSENGCEGAGGELASGEEVSATPTRHVSRDAASTRAT